MTMLPHALALAAQGFPVFPANPAQRPSPFSKAPHLQGESEEGRKDGGHWLASANPAVVTGWWRRWPRALIGFPTGLRTSCIVADLDPKAHSAEAMLAALSAWCGGLAHVDPETGEVLEPGLSRTQSGGFHLWFAWPEEAVLAEIAARLSRMGQGFEGVIGNRTGLFRAFLKAGECPAELANIDVRGEGGYVIAPPSVMADGKAYEWVLPRGERLPPLPRRLRGVITGEFIPDAEVTARREAARAARRYAARPASGDRVQAYVARSVRGALATAQRAGEGNRNAAVFWAACRLGEFVRGGQLGAAEAEALLLAHLPAGVSPNEPKIRGTIRSGLTNQKTPAFDPASLGERQGRAA